MPKKNRDLMPTQGEKMLRLTPFDFYAFSSPPKCENRTCLINKKPEKAQLSPCWLEQINL